MAKYIIHTADSRGYANHGWLKSYHTFSFAQYYDAERIHFGALRVLNDDEVAAGMGFGTHPHQNMEIVSIPLEGKLSHKDSMGSSGFIEKGEIQIMSAGSGVSHSEMNGSTTDLVKFLQIWVIPNQNNVEPRYGQMKYEVENNQLKTLIQPIPSDDTLWLHQDAWFKLGKFNSGQQLNVNLENPKQNGLYLFVLNGNINVDNNQLSTRDAIGIWETDSINIAVEEDANFLIIEVPMI